MSSLDLEIFSQPLSVLEIENAEAMCARKPTMTMTQP